MTIWPFYAFLFLAGVGAGEVLWWGYRSGLWAYGRATRWADHRAFMRCAHAIVAYEFGRGRHIGPSIKYALKIMRGAA